METNINNNLQGARHNGRVIGGAIILVVGAILLIDQLNIFFIPEWLYSWPMWIIGFGVYMGAKYNFRKPIWIWMIVLGCAFLFTENFDNAGRLVWPVALMGMGTWIVLKNQKHTVTAYPGNQYQEL